jgi:ABC-type multidrug transport system fused ATPase/permease subunit
MGNGKILEQGNFQELANNGVHFQKLLKSQVEMSDFIKVA